MRKNQAELQKKLNKKEANGEEEKNIMKWQLYEKGRVRQKN